MYKIHKLFISACLLAFLPANFAFAETIDGTNYTLSTALDGAIDVAVQPSGAVSTDSQDLIVSTTCPAGYDIYISMDGGDNKIYRNADKTSNYFFSPATGTISSPNTLGNNQWGFNITNSTTNFSQVPTDATIVKTVNTTTDQARTTFTYGIKASQDAVSGDYIGTVIYSVIPNPDCFQTAFEKSFTDNGKTKMAANDGKQYYKMQDMNQGICDAVPTPTKNIVEVPEITLIDTRDKELYTVRKLADGNCWMTQNLRITGKTISSTDSDMASGSFTIPAAQTTAFTNTADNNQVGAVSSDPDHGGGAYYSWYTATAGTGTAVMSTQNQNATSSICPKGWQLPEGGASTNKSFNNLITTTYGIASSAAGSTALQAQPLQFVLAGSYNTSGFGAGGSNGYYWSSSVNRASNAYDLNFYSSGVNPQSSYAKYLGFSVRCVSRDDPKPENNSALTQALADAGAEFEEAADGEMYYTMQSMTNSICGAVSTPANTVTNPPEATLIDTRDKELYTVRKLADGNCWMTQNLRLVGSRTLTSSDSDVSSNYTLPAAQTSAFTNTSNNNQVGAVQSSYGNGAYYSWYAATAGTGTASMSYGKATSSICPKGWQLPEGGASTTKSFNNLITTTYGIASSAAGSTALQAQPLQFVLAGLYDTPGFVNGDSRGNYWSSSVRNASYAYRLLFYSSNVSPRVDNYKYLGYSVRCVAR